VALIYQLFKKQKLKVAKQMLERKVLQNELDEKERELTSFVLNMVRLNEKKLGIINYLKKQKHRLKKENQDVIDTAIRDLEFDQDAKVWEEFELRFNKVNSEFYQKLANLYPDLTLNEKRLCAFLLMNMTTKEISSITGQSVDAIGKARTRLRKKLGITNQDDGIADVLSSL
jgi:DNA-binding CsgD family transcriptional regulator